MVASSVPSKTVEYAALSNIQLDVIPSKIQLNGPCVIHVPDWVPNNRRAHPSAMFYLYASKGILTSGTTTSMLPLLAQLTCGAEQAASICLGVAGLVNPILCVFDHCI